MQLLLSYHKYIACVQFDKMMKLA